MMTKFDYRATYNVDLGYIYKKKGNSKKSEKQFAEALSKIKIHPNLAYSTSNQFQIYLETLWALRAYQVAEKYNPKLNFDIQKANLYGELAMVDSMLFGYFAIIDKQPGRKSSIQRYLTNFLKQNPSDEIGNKVKNTLLVKSQETNNPTFTELLLWYFIEKKNYNSAFTQAKSLYKRNYAGLNLLQQLGEDALSQNQIFIAEKYFNYIIDADDNGPNFFLATQSVLELQDMKLKNKMSDIEIEKEYQQALTKTTLGNEHFDLIISYVKFLAFKKLDTNLGLSVLEEYTKPYSNYENIYARKHLVEGDIYLAQKKFTKSFLAYQKAETWSQEQIISDEAKFKSIKVAYYKGDFKWAKAQSKVLKKSVSKWYANNAAELFMLLQSSMSADSSEAPIKLYVNADLLALQGKTDSAYAYYNQLTASFPQHYLVPNAMLAKSEILTKTMAYNTAIETLKALYQKYPNINLSPLVLLRLSEVYLQKIKNQEEAKIWLKELMVKFPDSPQAEQAREMYRKNL